MQTLLNDALEGALLLVFEHRCAVSVKLSLSSTEPLSYCGAGQTTKAACVRLLKTAKAELDEAKELFDMWGTGVNPWGEKSTAGKKKVAELDEGLKQVADVVRHAYTRAHIACTHFHTFRFHRIIPRHADREPD